MNSAESAVPGARSVTHRGVELFFRIAGHGIPILALHAGIADGRMWQPQFASLRDGCLDGYQLIAPDLPGYGATSVPAGSFSYDELFCALLAGLGIDSTWVWGVSFGCRLALEWALAHQGRVLGIVVVSPLLDRFADSESVASFVTMEEQYLAAGNLAAATELNLRMWLSGPRRTIDEVPGDITAQIRDMQLDAFVLQAGRSIDAVDPGIDLAGRAAEIDLPALVVHGSIDHPCVIESAAYLAARMPKAHTWVAEGTAHLPPVEAPAAFNSRVRAFMDAGRAG